MVRSLPAFPGTLGPPVETENERAQGNRDEQQNEGGSRPHDSVVLSSIGISRKILTAAKTGGKMVREVSFSRLAGFPFSSRQIAFLFRGQDTILLTAKRPDTCPQERNEHWDRYHGQQDDLTHLCV